MNSLASSLALSREEQEELARSNKKVKDVNHSGFREGQDSMPSSPSLCYGSWNRATFFKDKLIGEIPSAFSQAFNLVNRMEDESDSDEGEDSPSFINRLLLLWKPARRLECVVGHGFFLTRFSLREDYDSILKKGPRFIGEHFLSIRPWEPDFCPATTNVSSVAVWIRLNELPIEYYNEEALVQIGKTIGTVLRIDTHIVSETRGRLCFDCGRVGHDRENCLFTIWRESFSKLTAIEADCGVVLGSCSLYAPDMAKDKERPTVSVLHAEHEEASDGIYCPWVMVTRKKTRSTRSSGTLLP
nr:hypothetical protein CFP56_39660 [Quercus suber]